MTIFFHIPSGSLFRVNLPWARLFRRYIKSEFDAAQDIDPIITTDDRWRIQWPNVSRRVSLRNLLNIRTDYLTPVWGIQSRPLFCILCCPAKSWSADGKLIHRCYFRWKNLTDSLCNMTQIWSSISDLITLSCMWKAKGNKQDVRLVYILWHNVSARCKFMICFKVK
jgi:hypothetical protein